MKASTVVPISLEEGSSRNQHSRVSPRLPLFLLPQGRSHCYLPLYLLSYRSSLVFIL